VLCVAELSVEYCASAVAVQRSCCCCCFLCCRCCVSRRRCVCCRSCRCSRCCRRCHGWCAAVQSGVVCGAHEDEKTIMSQTVSAADCRLLIIAAASRVQDSDGARPVRDVSTDCCARTVLNCANCSTGNHTLAAATHCKCRCGAAAAFQCCALSHLSLCFRRLRVVLS
jgi:hypothetical protein